jgi:hypothetical protein
MGQDTGQIRVAANGQIRVAPITATLPANIDAAYSGDWVDLGYASEDGVQFTDGKTIENIPVWQLFYAARRIVTEKDAFLVFALRQWSGDTVTLAFGGGDLTADGPGQYRYTPPTPETIDERALAVDWQDGTINYRLLVPRGLVTENVETQLVRSAAADLPITFGIIGDETLDPWILLTDDPALEPASS